MAVTFVQTKIEQNNDDDLTKRLLGYICVRQGAEWPKIYLTERQDYVETINKGQDFWLPVVASNREWFLSQDTYPRLLVQSRTDAENRLKEMFPSLIPDASYVVKAIPPVRIKSFGRTCRWLQLPCGFAISPYPVFSSLSALLNGPEPPEQFQLLRVSQHQIEDMRAKGWKVRVIDDNALVCTRNATKRIKNYLRQTEKRRQLALKKFTTKEVFLDLWWLFEVVFSPHVFEYMQQKAEKRYPKYTCTFHLPPDTRLQSDANDFMARLVWFAGEVRKAHRAAKKQHHRWTFQQAYRSSLVYYKLELKELKLRQQLNPNKDSVEYREEQTRLKIAAAFFKIIEEHGETLSPNGSIPPGIVQTMIENINKLKKQKQAQKKNSRQTQTATKRRGGKTK